MLRMLIKWIRHRVIYKIMGFYLIWENWLIIKGLEIYVRMLYKQSVKIRITKKCLIQEFNQYDWVSLS